MRNILFLLLFAFYLPLNAQHLKFMGIPIDGTINSFQQKLAAKGLVPDKEYNAVTEKGIRFFKGLFSGNEARIMINYDAKTNIVYRAKAIIDYTDLDVAISKYEELKNALLSKYKQECISEGVSEGHNSLEILVKNNGVKECDWDKSTGRISLYISDFTYYGTTKFFVSVDYHDRINTEKNNAHNLDDL